MHRQQFGFCVVCHSTFFFSRCPRADDYNIFFLSTCQYNISRSTHTIPNTMLFMTHSIMKLANHFRTQYLQSCFIILMRYINETFNSFELDELLEQKKKYNSTNELFISNQ